MIFYTFAWGCAILNIEKLSNIVLLFVQNQTPFGFARHGEWICLLACVGGKGGIYE